MMKTGDRIKGIVFLFVSLTLIVSLSAVSTRILDAKKETVKLPGDFLISEDMTLKDFAEKNGLSNHVVRDLFKITDKAELEKKISDFGSRKEVKALITKRMALISEEAVKDWKKIAVKFVLWVAFLVFVFFFLKKRKLTGSLRNILLLTAVTVFGIITGSDPGPMGTVKDAVVLFGSSGAVFPPRMIALSFFLLTVVIANKYICSWGCQAGTLQDFIFRNNRDRNGKVLIWKQFKVPFALSNTIRIFIFFLTIAAAFLFSYDLIEPMDIFRIYHPLYLTAFSIVLIAIIMAAGLFIYRPWCTFLCPFGLVGWLFEKISIVKINVDYEKCIACGKCADACPTTVMDAILKRKKKTIPDCFSCYTCCDVCPTGAIKYSADKRVKPPAGKF